MTSGMMIYRIILILTALFPALATHADGVRTIKGEYTFYGEGSHSLDHCKRQALEGARITALAKEFGTIVSQDIYQRDLVTENDESTYFSMLNASEVKGEWIADSGEPRYDIKLDADGHYVVKCTVTGKARPISNESVEFMATVLRNGTEPRFSDTRFRAGDEMFLLFKAPVDGYVAAYLTADDNYAYRLLPYSNGNTGEVKVKHDKEYVFFSAEKAERSHGIVDEFVMTANSDIERNQLYVIFSPKPFTRTLDNRHSDNLPPRLGVDEFTRWLAGSRNRDTKMGVKVIHMEVTR